MAATRTTLGRIVTHNCHFDDLGCGSIPLTPEDISLLNVTLSLRHPNAVAVALETREYNCHGFAVASSHGWYHHPQRFFEDDYDSLPLSSSPLIGDIVVYRHAGNPDPMHTAVVMEVSNNQITRVRSKWAAWKVFDHALADVPWSFGIPDSLLRRKTDPVPNVALVGEITMTEESTQEIIDRAIRNLSDPHVYLEVVLASTPEVAKIIIESLPGVRELIALGTEATPSVVQYLKSEETQASEERASIALYILERIPTENSTDLIASAIRERKFTGLSMNMAADALLTSIGLETTDEVRITAAMKVAENLK